jgi:hypothetical protein
VCVHACQYFYSRELACLAFQFGDLVNFSVPVIYSWCRNITPHACARGIAISFVCRLSIVSLLSWAQKSPDLEISAFELLINTINPSKLSKNWLHCALTRPTSVTNTMFIGHAYRHYPLQAIVFSADAHNLAQYLGKGCQQAHACCCSSHL